MQYQWALKELNLRLSDYESEGEIPAVPKYRHRRNSAVCVYAIRRPDTGEVKIGFANEPHRRLAELQTAHAVALELCVWFRGNPQDEQALHEHFADDRLLGEWFRETPRLLDWMERQSAYLTRDMRRVRRRRTAAVAGGVPSGPDRTDTENTPVRRPPLSALVRPVGDLSGDLYGLGYEVPVSPRGTA